MAPVFSPGLGVIAIPGIGPVVAAGWLAATAVGAAAGAVAGAIGGGIVGSLTRSGVTEEDAHFYAEGVRRGGSLVSARVVDDRVAVAQEILASHDHVDMAARRDVFRDTGWRQFDEKGRAYSEEEILRARQDPRNADALRSGLRDSRTPGPDRPSTASLRLCPAM